MNTRQKNSYPVFLIVILLLIGIIPATAEKWENTKQKEIVKTFDISLSDFLQIDNRYGNITVTHQNESKVIIRVEIESKARNEKRAQENLDRVSIDMKKSGNIVSAITSISSNNWNGNGNNERLTINYYVSMPSKLASELSQRYGNIILPPQNEGKSKLIIKYGNIQGGNFTAPLILEAQYGTVDIKDIETANMELAYIGNISFGNAKELFVDSKYSTMKGINVGRIKVEKKYGGLTLHEVESIVLDLSYGNAKFEKITKSMEVENLAYSGLEVGELVSNFSKAFFDARSGNVTLGISPNTKFNITTKNMKSENISIKGLNASVVEKEDNDERYEVNGGDHNRVIYFTGNNYSNLIIKSR